MSTSSNTHSALAAQDVNQSLIERFNYISANYPENEAVITSEDTLSYSDLDLYSNVIAHSILHNNSNSKTVGLITSPGSQRVAGIIAILKAGKICVPIDKINSDERNRYICNNAELGLILTELESIEYSQKIAPAGSIVLPFPNREYTVISPLIATPPLQDDMAFLIYTSGSTGVPKGVIHTHKTILHNAYRMTASLAISENDKILNASSLGFIAGVSEIMVGILNGCSIIPVKITACSLSDVINLLKSLNPTVLNLTPTILRNLTIAFMKDRYLPSVRVVRLGGEAVRNKDLETCFKMINQSLTVQVAYGSTETGLISYLNITAPINFNKTIGVQANGIELAVNNDSNIIVKSRYLSPGYWKLPELTSERFISSLTEQDEVYYNTGDVGKYTVNGDIEYIGRSDSQIKIMGQRVDISEIEHALLALPYVSDALLDCSTFKSGDVFIVAFVILLPGEDVCVGEIRKRLQLRLPFSWIPKLIKIVEKFPMTPHGKLEKTLALDFKEDLVTETGPEGGELERIISNIWRDLLNINTIDCSRSYFEYGVDSLQLVALCTQIETRLNVEIGIDTVFSNHTIASQAKAVEAAKSKLTPISTISAIRLSDNPDADSLFLLPGIMGHSQVFSKFASHIENDLNIYGINYPGMDFSSDPLDSVIDNANFIFEEALSKINHGKCVIGGYSFGGLVAYELAQILSPRLLILWDTYYPTQLNRPKHDFQKTPSLNLTEKRLSQLRYNLNIAARTYIPETYYGNLLVFYTDETRQNVQTLNPNALGWDSVVAGNIHSCMLPGKHYDIFREPVVTISSTMFDKWIELYG